MEQNNSFNYTYSAKEQDEITAIRKKYGLDTETQKDEPTTLEQLRELDKSTTRPGLIAGIAVGTVGTLVMGTGMSMAMVGSAAMFVPGIIVGLVGIAGVVAAYPLHKAITKKKRAQNAEKIRELSEKLLEQQK